MNETEIGILVLGSLIVLGVIAYNKWQERQHRRNVEKSFHSSERTDDVLLARREADFSISPAMSETASSWETEAMDESVPQEDTEWDAAEEPDEPDESDEPQTEISQPAWSTGATALPEDDLLSPMIDLIIELKGASPIDLAALRRDYAEAFLPFGKRLNWAVLNEAEGKWEFMLCNAPQGGGSYRRLRVGLQLVDREGVVKAELISDFIEFFPRLAEKLGVACQVPEAGLAEWLEQAEQLDVFCAGLDIVLCLNLAPEGGRNFAGTQIRALAEAENMTLEDGIYTLRDEYGTTLFCFWNTDEEHPFRADDMKYLKSSDLTFQFDVPCVPRGQHAFSQMLAVIRRFAKVMDGVLIDDQGNPLSDETLEQIRQDYVIRPQGHMLSEGLPAGSFLARRLFS
ncbi:MAG: cell division protein ZipA C-terminal FtsZ-binding domain-containing protein [Betaproteobacteria bacterium]|nr:cell division protein ZipA C-terminal FtsZ-binding domain-containing protein [Betaproteobacteria bacterium]